MEIILYDVTHTSYIRFTRQNKIDYPYILFDAKVINLFESTKLFKLMKVKS